MYLVATREDGKWKVQDDGLNGIKTVPLRKAMLDYNGAVRLYGVMNVQLLMTRFTNVSVSCTIHPLHIETQEEKDFVEWQKENLAD